jgi:cytochrome bd-type quinol oxidase subunit 2
VETHGSGESLLGRSFHLPERETGDLFRYAVVIAAAILLNVVVLVSFSWFGVKDLIASLPSLFVVFLVALAIGFLLVLAHFLVRGRRRDTEEKPVFLIGFAVLFGGWLLYSIVWFLIEVFRQS